MPVQDCSIENKPGYKWGESGKCYTYSPGNEAARKEAKRKAFLQGYAMGELTEMEQNEWIPPEMELAEIIDVPVLHAGVFPSHNAGPIEVTEEELDDIVEGSNELQHLILDSIETGEYHGNEEVTKRLTKPIPGLLNFKHQQILPETLKEATKNVCTSFRKALIDGKNWIVQRFSYVPTDIADTIRREFPFRSVEMLPLKNPATGKFYPKIIRSTAFLDKFTPPAVPGQSPELLVEFAAQNEPLTIITTQGVSIMPTEGNQKKSVDVSELQAMKETLRTNAETLAAQDKALTELQAEVAKAKEEREKALELAKQKEAEKQEVSKEVQELQAIRNEVQELRAKNEELDSDKLINHLKRFRKIDEQTFQVTPAYLEIVEPIIRKNGVVELAKGQSYRQAMESVFDEIAELASKDAILLPLTTQGQKSYSQDKKPKDFDEEVHELMKAENLEIGEAIERVTAEHQKVYKEA